jgi:ferric-dicitrate binding protein FerR (iron transport regulator)
MKRSKNDMDYTLIGKYLEGIASPGEKEQVDKWINESAGNKAEFQRIEKIWNLAESGGSGRDVSVNTENAWKKLQGRILDEDVRQRILSGQMRKDGRTSRIIYYLSGIAAVIVIALGFYALYNTLIKKPELIDVVAENEIMETVLPDKSSVTLNENTTITYPESFVKDKRVVELKGEAFFDVKRNPDRPFIIQVPEAIIEVLGTSFNVRALEQEPEVSVTVRDGKVMLSDADNIAYVVLEKHEKGILNKETGHIEKYVSTDESEMFWKTRTLIFRETPLSKVFEVLEKVYTIKITIQNDNIEKCLLSAKFQEQEIEEILANIALSFDLEIQKKDSTFEISGDGC